MLGKPALAILLALTALAVPAGPAARPFVVVLDPGHGGSNTGAAGVVEGVYEKRLTLALARGVARRLESAPGVVVVLTREDDRFLTLRERVRRANAAGADLFVSVHANASPNRSQRGVETWVLAPEALEIDTPALRGADGAPRPGLDRATAAILDDVERGVAQIGAARLATLIQARLRQARPESPDRGVRQGSFDVLMGPTMPAVLVEVGFLDNPVEGAELLRRDVRAGIADALAAAILDYRAGPR
jgi:N-acetylmuramoyl-L-alanine amidase